MRTSGTSSRTAPARPARATASTPPRSTSGSGTRIEGRAGAAIAALAVAALAACGGAAGARTTAAAPAEPAPVAGLTAAQLAGQRVAFAFDGTTPPPALVRRIRRGEAGAVVLFSRNVPSRAALRGLTARLQAIPRPAAVDAPLLVMVDQEGGPVRRIPGPPARSAPELGAAGPRATRAAGRAAGNLLAGLGVNVDLAPVSDVGRPGSALVDEGRTFPGGPAAVARSAVAFADGLRDAGVAATAKHFPGFGAGVVNTDDAPVTIATPLAALRAVDMRPFRAMIAHRVPLVMVSTAIYPALDRRPAALSRRVVTGELRGELGFEGVVVTDALDTPALAPVGGQGQVAIRSARAGADLLILAGSYAAGERAAEGLTRAIRQGALARDPAEAAVGRLMALRADLGERA